MSVMSMLVRKLYETLLLNCIISSCYGVDDEILQRDLFYIRYNIPFSLSTLMVEDNPVTDRDILYYLYNKQYKNVSLASNLEYINRKYPLKIMIHGWTEHSYVEWYRNIRTAYMKKGLYNIILVDWSLKGDTDYLSASRNAKIVGNKIGEFLINLSNKRGIPYKNMHLISHSLGCHVAGFTGKKVYEIANRKIGRITALDPAAPIFDLVAMGGRITALDPAAPIFDLVAMGPTNRLSKRDATFVDVIHTDGGMLGFNYPIGTVDFFPNGGTVDFFPNGGTAVQPGCSLLKVDVKYEDLFCSHASSHQLFINSIINNRKFVAKYCDSWEKFIKGLCNTTQSVVVGESVPATISGRFYFETKDDDIMIMYRTVE
ncbi:Lipase [Popillia japonica]|uniref:Lipase n=1 Tax=Popillia japonica TaxID=7064 RepID=A0AAW1KQW8_POPJA